MGDAVIDWLESILRTSESGSEQHWAAQKALEAYNFQLANKVITPNPTHIVTKCTINGKEFKQGDDIYLSSPMRNFFTILIQNFLTPAALEECVSAAREPQSLQVKTVPGVEALVDFVMDSLVPSDSLDTSEFVRAIITIASPSASKNEWEIFKLAQEFAQLKGINTSP